MLTRFDDQERFTKKIKELLTQQGVAVFDSKEVKEILENKNVKLLFAFMRLVENERDSLGWFTVLAESGGIGSTTRQSLIAHADSANSNFADAVLQQENDGLGSKAAFRNIRDRLNLIKNAYAERQQAGETSWGGWVLEVVIPLMGFDADPKLAELLEAADSRMEVEKPSLGYFISQLVPIAKDIANEQQSGVRFMTMQGSKGLTSRVTIVVGVDNDLIPSPRNPDKNEERRLLYVAMTRSQEFLFMTWANIRRGQQARSGRLNVQRRNYSNFLDGGPIRSEDGDTYISKFS